MPDSHKPEHSKDLEDQDNRRAAPGAVLMQENSPFPPNLQAVIDAWPSLPEPVKAGILAMVKAAGNL